MKPINKYLVNRHITKKDTTIAGKPIKYINELNTYPYFVIVDKHDDSCWPAKIIGKCNSFESKKHNKLTSVEISCEFFIGKGHADSEISRIYANDSCGVLLPYNELRFPNDDEMILIDEIESFLLVHTDITKKEETEFGSYNWDTSKLTLNGDKSPYTIYVDVDPN